MRRPSQALLSQAAILFGCTREPAYYAGGHRWSDGIVYYLEDRQLMLKLMIHDAESSLAALRLRMQFAEYLSQQGIACLKPLHSVNDELVEVLHDDEHRYICYAWPKLEGSTLQDLHPRELTSFYQDWGAMVGKCHNLATAYPLWHGEAQPEAEAVSRKREALALAQMNPDAEVRQAWLDLHEQLDQRPLSRATHGFVHNDPHPQNIIRQGNTLNLLDFDVAGTHFFAIDVAICIFSEYSRIGFHSRHQVPRDEMQELFLNHFIPAYLAEYALPESELKDIELFLNYRRMVMFTVFYEQIALSDPAYWQKFKEEILSAKPFLPDISLV